MASELTITKYRDSNLVPNVLFRIIIDAMLVTGPANKNTNAAPGDIPFNIKAIAIGMLDVEQI